MSSTTVAPAGAAKSTGSPKQGQSGIERRRRYRAKITAQVHVRAANFPDGFEEVCASVDVSRDGLLFLAIQPGYSKGQWIDVTFPYSTAPGALNQAQPAEVVRVIQQSDGKIAVGVQLAAVQAQARSERKAHLAAGNNPADVPPAAKATPRHQSVVLAIESDARCAETIRNVLGQDGYTVVVVPTAKEGLEFLRENVPDVFLAGMECADVSGHELCAIIKRNERLQHVPVILLTRSAQPADYSASHQLGAVVCTAKPFQPERLLHVVRLVAPPPTARSFYGAHTANTRNL
ncbi:MAG: response regulator [Candidatus Acidiferrales bacterium]|jgi:CheY-like chemotaxis protein